MGFQPVPTRAGSPCYALVWMVALAGLSAPLLASTPTEQLDAAIELFDQGDYEGARKALLDLDKAQLSDDQNQRRTELLEEVGRAVNQSNRARHNLEDAKKAFDSGDRATAERLYRAVMDNNYATAPQKQQARQGLALVEKQESLEQKLEATTRPARGASTAPAREPRRNGRVANEPRRIVAAETQPEQEVVVSGEITDRNRADARRLIQAGDEAVARGQYDQAEQRFAEALRLMPNHPEALKGLDIVRQHRAVEGEPNLIETQEKIRGARWERAVQLFRQNENEIRQLINQRRYDEARRLLISTRGLLDAARPDARPPEDYTRLSLSLDSLGKYIDTEQHEEDLRRAEEERNAAREQDRQRLERDIRERDERIAQLMIQAMTLRKERQYEKAADVLREILTIDANYLRAKYLLDDMIEMNQIERQKLGREFYLRQQQTVMTEADRNFAPEVAGVGREVYAYPSEDEWRMISQRDPFGALASGEKEEDRVARQQLSVIIPDVVFPEGTPLEDVIEFLRTQGRLPVDVNWNALSLVGIDRTATLSLNLHNVKLSTALELALENVGGASGVALAYDVVDGIVRVSTVEELNRKTFSRVYDVQDLLIQIRSFRADPNQLGQGFGGGGGGIGGGIGGGGFGGGGFGGGGGGFGGGGGGFGGGGGGGGGDDDDDSSEEDRQERIEELEELIKNLIEPGTWEPEATTGSLQIWNDRLIVRHTASVHRQLVDLFRQLRESQDLQVSVEARFITMTTNFLEEIGVNLDAIINQGNAGLDRAVNAATGATIDPLTGSSLLLPRQFGAMGFTPAVAPFGVPLPQTGVLQPYGDVALVPGGNPGQWYQRHTTPIPILNNTIDLAQPRTTNIAGSGVGYQAAAPAMQMFGSFLDNIQVDFLLRATQLDARSSSVEAPRLVVFNNRRAYITVGTNQNFILLPGFLPAGGSGVGGQSAQGVSPTIGTAFSGRTFDVLPVVSPDRKYVTMELRPQVQRTRFQNVVTSPGSVTGQLQLTAIDFTEIRTNAIVPDGGTILLGGLKLAEENEVEAGVPVLSKIPAVKRAFTNRSKVKDEQVVLILIKPTIIIPKEQEDLTYPDLITNRPAIAPGG